MKRFDLKQIMKTAHRTYKYVAKKQGKSFGEVLKSTWKLAKQDAAIEAALQAQREQMNRENELMAKIKVTEHVYQWPEGVTPEAVYPMNNLGAMGAHFVGD